MEIALIIIGTLIALLSLLVMVAVPTGALIWFIIRLSASAEKVEIGHLTKAVEKIDSSISKLYGKVENLARDYVSTSSCKTNRDNCPCAAKIEAIQERIKND
jgi:signal transduction histidine kinase